MYRISAPGLASGYFLAILAQGCSGNLGFWGNTFGSVLGVPWGAGVLPPKIFLNFKCQILRFGAYLMLQLSI